MGWGCKEEDLQCQVSIESVLEGIVHYMKQALVLECSGL